MGWGGKPEGKRSKCRWEDNIKMDFQNAGWGGGGRAGIVLAQVGTDWQAAVNAIMSPQDP